MIPPNGLSESEQYFSIDQGKASDSNSTRRAHFRHASIAQSTLDSGVGGCRDGDKTNPTLLNTNSLPERAHAAVESCSTLDPELQIQILRQENMLLTSQLMVTDLISSLAQSNAQYAELQIIYDQLRAAFETQHQYSMTMQAQLAKNGTLIFNAQSLIRKLRQQNVNLEGENQVLAGRAFTTEYKLGLANIKLEEQASAGSVASFF